MAASLTTVAQAAAQFLGVLDSGEGLSTQQLNDSLAEANNMLDNWSTEGLFIVADTQLSWPTVAGTQAYTIGTGQTINVTRPVRIVAASYSNAAGPGMGLEVVDEKTWAAIPDRQATSWAPKSLFWDRGFTNGVVYLSPIPAGVLTVVMHTWSSLTQFADLTTPIAFAPGYLRMVELGLAIEMAPYFSMAVPASVATLFADAAGRIRRLNASLIGDIPPEVAEAAKQ